MGKCAALLFITFLAVSSLIIVESTFAQSTPRPYAPEFTLKYVDHSYDIPSSNSYEIDPYTGEEVRTGSAARHVENKTIEITIENHPFTPYTDAEGHYFRLFYNVEYRGHFGGNWSRHGGYYRSASDLDYTVLVYGLSTRPSTDDMPTLGEIPAGSQIDFRVQAFIGYYIAVVNPPQQFGEPYHLEYTGETSEWSNTQTIAIPESPTSTPNHGITLAPEQVNIIAGTTVITIVICLGLGLLIYLIKKN